MRFMHSDNWDDLRFVLAVADIGTVSGAARRLGVNHATVLRRVAGFEDRYGAEIFERTAKGYVVRADRARMIEAARDVGSAVDTVAQLLRGAQAPIRGSVRVSSTDTFCQFVLPEVLRDLHKAVSGLNVALISTNAYSDFARSDADIAVRPSLRLSDDMVGDVAAHLGFGVYGRDEANPDWLGFAGPLLRSAPALWMAEHVSAGQIVAAADSFVVLAQLAHQGLGRAVLPCCVGGAAPDLLRLDVGDLPAVPIWVACHQEVAQLPRVVASRKFLSDALAQRADWLAGAAVI